MKYFKTNTLKIYYPTTFMNRQVTATARWKVAWTQILEPVKFLAKGDPLGDPILSKRSRQNIILVRVNTTREQFIDAISRYFSKKLKVNVHELRFEFEKFMPFGEL